MEQQTAEETYESALLALRCRQCSDSQLSLKTPVDERTTTVRPRKELCLAMISV